MKNLPTVFTYLQFANSSVKNDITPYLLNIFKHNNNVPANVQLLCGDLLMSELIVPHTEKAYSNLQEWGYMHNYIKRGISEYALSCDMEKVTIFIDTNSSLTINTTMVMMTAEKWIMPINPFKETEWEFATMLKQLCGKTGVLNYTHSYPKWADRQPYPILHMCIATHTNESDIAEYQKNCKTAATSFNTMYRKVS